MQVTSARPLSDLGYSVVEAASAEEAIRLIEKWGHLDVLVTNHLMPGTTGTDLVDNAQLRSRTYRCSWSPAMLSQEDFEPTLFRLIKPFRADELAALLSALMKA